MFSISDRDCYVAACGMPIARSDHAVAMARFARDCLYKMNELTKHLEVRLVSLDHIACASSSDTFAYIFCVSIQGPDTSALAFRIGLHSGPVTGGVLRGENARFQLFGDVSS